MDIQAEKLQLIQAIIQIDDQKLLHAVKSMLEYGLQKEDVDFWNDLSPEDEQRIEMALQAIDSNNVISHTNVISELRKKLVK